jgi:hypothetical protein
MNVERVMYERVYYVEDENSSTPLNPIAIRPTIQDKKISWEDTSRGQKIKVADIKLEYEDPKIKKFPKQIIILSDQGDKIILKELDVPLYNEKVKEYVVGKPSFNKDAELQGYFLTTNFEAF